LFWCQARPAVAHHAGRGFICLAEVSRPAPLRRQSGSRVASKGVGAAGCRSAKRLSRSELLTTRDRGVGQSGAGGDRREDAHGGEGIITVL
jgi:hypothetical protein